MRFWDASALVPLVAREARTDEVRGWVRSDDSIVTWAWTRVEVTSAIERRTRDGLLSRGARRNALDRLDTLANAWDEVTDVLAVRSLALLLLARHSLRAADAGQLAAALLLRDETGMPTTFVCLDDRLATTAEREGLLALPRP